MKIILFILSIVTIFCSYSQNILTGYVKSGTIPISFVKIYSIKNYSAVLSEKDGSFALNCSVNDTIIFESNQFELDTFMASGLSAAAKLSLYLKVSAILSRVPTIAISRSSTLSPFWSYLSANVQILE